MSHKILYNFSVYLSRPYNMCAGITCVSWDIMVTLYGSNVEEALKTMPEEYANWKIHKVEYPIGWPHFPLFPPSTCTAGAVGVDLNRQLYLR